MTLAQWALLAVPPLAGALIGFVTNVIAIKMLFRPLREICVAGIRLPFTPGILPRQRHKLADSIGAMVERELFTREMLRGRLADSDVREKLRAAVSRFTARFFERPLDELLSGGVDSETGALVRSLSESVPKSPAFDTLAAFVKQRAGAEFAERYPAFRITLVDFLRRSDIRRGLEVQGRVLLSDIILKLNVFQRFFISAAQYDRTLNEQMPGIIDNLIERADEMLGEDSVREKALGALAAILDRQFAAGSPLGEIAAAFKEFFTRSRGGESVEAMLAVTDAQKKQLDEIICAAILRTADNEIENMLAAIDVRTMVSRRINALDMIRVERIILDVMANQLKWIDLFGAILGFLIGAFQAAVNLLLR